MFGFTKKDSLKKGQVLYKKQKDFQAQSQDAIWNQILYQFKSMPKERQDEILLRIYKSIYLKRLNKR